MASIYNDINYNDVAKYTDQLSGQLVREAVLKGRLVNDVTKLYGIKNAQTINQIYQTLTPQQGLCNTSGTISPTGSVNLNQITLTTSPIKVEESICIYGAGGLEEIYLGYLMEKGSYPEDLTPPEFKEEFVANLIEREQAYIEDTFVQGCIAGNTFSVAYKATYPTSYNLADGLITFAELTSTGTSSIVSGSTYSGATGVNQAGFTTTSSIGIVDSMISNIPSQILDKTDLTLFIAYEDARTLGIAIRNAGNGSFGQGNFWHSGDWAQIGGDANSIYSFVYPGSNVMVKAYRGFNGTKRMFITYKENVCFGTDLLDDFSNFKLFYNEPTDTMVFRSKWRQGAAFAWPQYVVWGNFSGQASSI
jgi:hypothetical protein